MPSDREDNPSDEFGRRVKQARLDLAASIGREVTQTEIGEAVGVSGVSVGQWEAGKKQPALGTIVRLARALRTTPGWLAFGEVAVVRVPMPNPDAEEANAEPPAFDDRGRAGNGSA